MRERDSTELGVGSLKFWGDLELERAQAGGNMELGWMVEPLTNGSHKVKQLLPWMDEQGMPG